MTDRENMTAEEKKAAAEAKRKATYARRRAQEEAAAAERNEQYRDKVQARAICRKIRDDENALDADRLKAISILMELTT